MAIVRLLPVEGRGIDGPPPGNLFHPCPGKPQRVRFPLARSPAGFSCAGVTLTRVDAPYQGLLDHTEMR